ncbi:peptidylprolyl isomerase [Phenylobacterium immobile]|uniref:peptidylprolyl isomerase n=1 Tax=Phenylobacterium immobile TaxID=21 RepID=UPI000B81B104|nr:peptidylprolyl isomerase [Phenylobacterium immobile]
MIDARFGTDPRFGAILACVLLSSVAAPVIARAQAAPPARPVATAPAAPTPALAPAPRANAFSESVAALVNDDIISTYDLAMRMRLLMVTSGVQPTQESLPQIQRESLVSLIDERLQLQELRRVERDQKIDIVATDAEVNEELDGIAKSNNLTRDQFVGELSKQGVSPDSLRQQIRAQMSWQRWINGRYGSRLRVGEDQIKATQQRLAASAAKPQYQIAEVLIDANRTGGMPEAMRGATQLVAQLQQGAPFAAVARQFSSSPTAASGGDAGWVSQGEMAPEVDAALEQLRPGQLSQPIPVRDGVYILYLRDKRAGAGGLMVNLKQAALALPPGTSPQLEAAARDKLMALKTQITSCSNLEAEAAKVPGVVAGDLGEAQVADLAPQFKDAAETLAVGQVSDPIRTAAGLHLVAVCGKQITGEGVPDHDQIENRLYGQQISMVSRRYMRDLRNSATIETR